jgi:hypothetical protein
MNSSTFRGLSELLVAAGDQEGFRPLFAHLSNCPWPGAAAGTGSFGAAKRASAPGASPFSASVHLVPAEDRRHRASGAEAAR